MPILEVIPFSSLRMTLSSMVSTFVSESLQIKVVSTFCRQNRTDSACESSLKSYSSFYSGHLRTSGVEITQRKQIRTLRR